MYYVTIFVLISALGQGQCLECFQCSKVSKISDCATRITCPANNHCHMRKYYLTGQQFYDMDCKPIIECKNQEVEDSVASVYSDDLEAADIGFNLWTVCCHEDLCSQNIDEKGKVIPHSQKRIECYDCASVDDPSACTQRKTCGPGEECLTNEHIGVLGKSAYHLSCIPKPICENVIKNAVNDGRAKRKALCTGCCNTARCNSKLCHQATPSPIIPTKSMNVPTTAKPSTPKPTTTPTPKPTTTTSTVPPTYNEQSLYHLIIKPASISAKTGSTAVFDCLFDMPVLTSMTVTWYFIDLSGHRHELYTEDKQNPELKYAIPEVASTDSGLYECEAKHGSNTWKADATLVVIG